VQRMLEPQSQIPNGQPATVPTRPDDLAEPPVEKTLDGVVATADVVQETVRKGQAATAGVLQEWEPRTARSTSR
jgi:hypothetical protein